MEEQTPLTNNRRAALKALAAATGAAGLAALPTRWSKPAVMVGAVPAHAQTSCVTNALLIENVEDFSLYNYAGSEEPDLMGLTFMAWNCGTGCLWFWMENSGSSDTFNVTILDDISFPVTLNTGEEFSVAVNLDTFQWDTAAGFAIDWASIGCEDPGDIFND